VHRRLQPYLCKDGATRRMKLSLFVFAADLLEIVKAMHIRPWAWKSTTPTDVFPLAYPDQLDEPDPEPPHERRTQSVMLQVSNTVGCCSPLLRWSTNGRRACSFTSTKPSSC
jgi:hypothetical protein